MWLEVGSIFPCVFFFFFFFWELTREQESLSTARPWAVDEAVALIIITMIRFPMRWVMNRYALLTVSVFQAYAREHPSLQLPDSIRRNRRNNARLFPSQSL